MNHFVNNNPLDGNFSKKYKRVLFGAGCFWGVERKFWQLEGVWVTSVGYAGGNTQNPTYEDVCYKETGHVEVVEVVYDPEIISFKSLLKVFWECHNPTQGMKQGNDVGTQYRSVIYCYSDEDILACLESKKIYQVALSNESFSNITTEIMNAPEYFLAEEYHQQYLAKNPNGYCGLGGTGCSLEI
jgi:peptide-methionine (S)-S-oxide reductase